jgi:phage-related baseplate assembly protein
MIEQLKIDTLIQRQKNQLASTYVENKKRKRKRTQLASTSLHVTPAYKSHSDP